MSQPIIRNDCFDTQAWAKIYPLTGGKKKAALRKKTASHKPTKKKEPRK